MFITHSRVGLCQMHILYSNALIFVDFGYNNWCFIIALLKFLRKWTNISKFANGRLRTLNVISFGQKFK